MKKGGFSNNLKLSIPPAGEQSITKFLYLSLSLSLFLSRSIDRCLRVWIWSDPRVCVICCRTQSGTFKDGDLRVNKDGVRIVSQSEPEAVSLFSFSF